MTHRKLRSAVAGRGFMLFPAAAYAVHEGRYRLGYGSQSAQALAAQGHGYLDSLAPWVALLVALGLGTFLVRLARVVAGRREVESRRNLAGLWVVAWACLVAIYAGQEWLEGLFAAGHPGGLGGVFGHGGLWAIALSAVAGLVVAVVLWVASLVVQAASRLAPRRVALRLETVPRLVGVTPVRRRPLAGSSAGRAPPAVV